MLKIQKETLTELNADQMAVVVGGQVLTGVGCYIRYPESCFAASCITND